MIRRLGVAGILGFLLMIAGFVAIGLKEPQIAGGLALIVAGLGIIVRTLIKNALGMMGVGQLL
jgi:hypothetical protein